LFASVYMYIKDTCTRPAEWSTCGRGCRVSSRTVPAEVAGSPGGSVCVRAAWEVYAPGACPRRQRRRSVLRRRERRASRASRWRCL